MPTHAEHTIIETRETPYDGVEVVNRIVRILDCFESGGLLSVTDLARQTGLPKTTCHRLLQTLQANNMVRKEGGMYGLGARPFSWVWSQVMSQPGRSFASPTLQHLKNVTDVTSIFCVRQGSFRIVVAMEEADQGSHRFVDIGQVAAIYAGAPSKVLIAWLTRHERERIFRGLKWVSLTAKTLSRSALEGECAQIRQRGWALSLGEREPNTFSVAVPVFGCDGGVVGAIAITGPLEVYRPASLPSWVAELFAAGRALSAELGFAERYPVKN